MSRKLFEEAVWSYPSAGRSARPNAWLAEAVDEEIDPEMLVNGNLPNFVVADEDAFSAPTMQTALGMVRRLERGESNPKYRMPCRKRSGT